MPSALEQQRFDRQARPRYQDQHGRAIAVSALLHLQPALPPRSLQETRHAAGRPMKEAGVFALRWATTADEPDIRALVGSVAMPGTESVRFAREPDYFLGTTIMGDPCDVLVARHRRDGRLAAIGCRGERRAFINGQASRLGY